MFDSAAPPPAPPTGSSLLKFVCQVFITCITGKGSFKKKSLIRFYTYCSEGFFFPFSFFSLFWPGFWDCRLKHTSVQTTRECRRKCNRRSADTVPIIPSASATWLLAHHCQDIGTLLPAPYCTDGSMGSTGSKKQAVADFQFNYFIPILEFSSVDWMRGICFDPKRVRSQWANRQRLKCFQSVKKGWYKYVFLLGKRVDMSKAMHALVERAGS